MRELKKFVGKMDLNSDPTDIKDGYHTNGRNLLFINETVRPILGTIDIPISYLPDGTNTVVGSGYNPLRRSNLFVVHNNLGRHGVYEYLYDTNVVEPVIANVPIGSGTGFLEGFDTSFLNIQNKYYHSISFMAHQMIFVDAVNNPFHVDIDRWKRFMGASFSTDVRPVSDVVLTYSDAQKRALVNQMKQFPEAPTGFYDTIPSGKVMDGRLYRVKIRYVYYGGYRSVTSNPSDWIKPDSGETIYGDTELTQNAITIEMNTGIESVEFIEILLTRDDWDGVYYIVQDKVLKFENSFDRIVQDNVILRYSYTGNQPLGRNIVPEEDLNFHYIPKQVSDCFYSDNGHVILSNYKVGFPSTMLNLEIFPDYVLKDFRSVVMAFSGAKSALTRTTNRPRNAPRVSTATQMFYHTAEDEPWEFYVPVDIRHVLEGCVIVMQIQVSDNANFDMSGDKWGRAYNLSYRVKPQDTLNPTTLRDAIYDYLMENKDTTYQFSKVSVSGRQGIKVEATITTFATFAKFYSIRASNTLNKYPQFKKGTNHYLGMVYFDEDGRHVGYEPFTAYMPFYNEVKAGQSAISYGWQSVFTIHIHHMPPLYARSYAMVYAGSDIDLYIQFLGSVNFMGNAVSENEKEPPYGMNTQKITALSFFNMINESLVIDYEFVKGDKIRAISDKNGSILSEKIDFEIVSFDIENREFVVNNGNGHNLDGYLLEIYRPSERSNIAYEIGPRRQCDPETGHKGDFVNQTNLNPAVIGIDHGDSWLRQRNLSFVLSSGLLNNPKTNFEATEHAVDCMEWTDMFKSRCYWFNKPHTDVVINREQHYFNYFTYSMGPYRLGTQDNSVFAFTANNEYAMRADLGAIIKMIQIGETVKCVMEYNLASIYIGKRVAYNADGSREVILTDTFVGQVNYQEKLTGSRLPESVIKVDRSLYYYDHRQNCIMVDYANGPQTIDNITNYFRDKVVISAVSGFNPKYQTVVFKLLYSDGSIDVIGIKGQDAQCFYDYSVEVFGHVEDNLISFNQGVLHLHDIGPVLEVQGSRVVAEIVAPFNDNAVVRRIFKGVAVKSNYEWHCPEITIPENEMYGIQECIIQKGAFDYVEGVFYAAIPCNMNTPNMTIPDALLNGDRMIGHVILIKFAYDGPRVAILNTVDCEYQALI